MVYFRSLGQKSRNNFVHFLVQKKNYVEIYWPLKPTGKGFAVQKVIILWNNFQIPIGSLSNMYSHLSEKKEKKLEMVFCYQNCSDLLWEKKIVLVTEKTFWNWRLKAKICKNFEITWTIYSNSERCEQFLGTECFSTFSWRFLRSNKLEQLEFKLEKIIGI